MLRASCPRARPIAAAVRVGNLELTRLRLGEAHGGCNARAAPSSSFIAPRYRQVTTGQGAVVMTL